MSGKDEPSPVGDLLRIHCVSVSGREEIKGKTRVCDRQRCESNSES